MKIDESMATLLNAVYEVSGCTSTQYIAYQQVLKKAQWLSWKNITSIFISSDAAELTAVFTASTTVTRIPLT